MGYLGNFIVYTLAMVGVIVVALLVFKNATTISTGKSSKHLRVIDTLNIGQRKMLYVVSAGKEKFLIAGDTDRTTLISKLESFEEPISAIAEIENEDFSTKSYSDHNKNLEKEQNRRISFRDTLSVLSKPNYIDKRGLGLKTGIMSKQKSEAAYSSVIRSLAEKMRG